MAFADVRPASWPSTDVPYVDAEAISYGGGNQTVNPCSRGIYVSSTGHLQVVMASGATVTFSNLPVGFVRIRVTQILQSGSTAAGLILR